MNKFKNDFKSESKEKKAYIDEVEFNRRVFSLGKDDPTNDSPDDSDFSSLQELNIGVDSLTEDEDDEI